MQRFHITITLIFVVCAASAGYMITHVSPYLDNGTVRTENFLLFLLLLWIAITLLFSLITYPIRVYLYPYIDRRFLTRKGIRQGAWLACAMVTVLLLSLTNTFNPVTVVMTLALLIVLEIWFT